MHANRLYRQTAASSGDDRVVSLLDDLERVLLEVAHSPEELHGVEIGKRCGNELKTKD